MFMENMKFMDFFSGKKGEEKSKEGEKNAHESLRGLVRDCHLDTDQTHRAEFNLEENRTAASKSLRDTLKQFNQEQDENKDSEFFDTSKKVERNLSDKDSEELQNILQKREKILHKYDEDKFVLPDLDEEFEGVNANKELTTEGVLRNGRDVITGGAALLTDSDVEVIASKIDSSEFEKSGMDVIPDFSLYEDKSGFRPNSETIPSYAANSTAENTLYFLNSKGIRDDGVLTFTKGEYTYNVDTNDESNRLKCLQALCENTQRNFKWFQNMADSTYWVLYDSDQFEVEHSGVVKDGVMKGGIPYLHFKESFLGNIDMPINLKSCFRMFRNCDLTYANFGARFNTEGITNMVSMFEGAIYRKGLPFYLNFRTENVKTMSYMFAGSKFEKGLVFPESFDTSNVFDMDFMFSGMHLDETIKFSDSFNTEFVKRMRGMFSESIISEGFKLLEMMNTENVLDMSYMFYKTQFPAKYRLGKDFVTLSVRDMRCMFSCARLPKLNNLIADFNTQNVKDFSGMFSRAVLSDSFTLPNTFITDNAETMEKMFYKCYLGENFVLPRTFTSKSLGNVTHMFAFVTFNSIFALPLDFKPELVKESFEMFGNCKGLNLSVKLNNLDKISTKLHMRYVEFYGA